MFGQQPHSPSKSDIEADFLLNKHVFRTGAYTFAGFSLGLGASLLFFKNKAAMTAVFAGAGAGYGLAGFNSEWTNYKRFRGWMRNQTQQTRQGVDYNQYVQINQQKRQQQKDEYQSRQQEQHQREVENQNKQRHEQQKQQHTREEPVNLEDKHKQDIAEEVRIPESENIDKDARSDKELNTNLDKEVPKQENEFRPDVAEQGNKEQVNAVVE